ncbi:MAG: S41 family peptidase [Phycisphaerales bacterium]
MKHPVSRAHDSRFGLAFLLGVSTLAGAPHLLAQTEVEAPPITVEDGGLTVAEWSDRVWTSAHRGDGVALSEYLSLHPEGFDDERLARVRAGLAHYQSNLVTAAQARAEAQAEALTELDEKLETGDLSQALRAAVKYQTLGESLDDALVTEQVKSVIEMAKAEIPKARESGDWLYQQELLFRLRTLFDDTSERGEYADYDHQLRDVNRRVSLLQQYAPHHLYDLRAALAARFGEEELPPFDEKSKNDWKERVRGVNMNMLEGGLRTTASQHIESVGSGGWRPLLQGGLDGLEILLTTDPLAETFNGLGNEQAVEEMILHIGRQKTMLAQTEDDSLSRRDLSRLMENILALNDRTTKLPEAVVIREFGEGAMFELSNVTKDDYTEIIWPDQIRRFMQSTQGNFVGIGVMIRHNERRDIVVVNPIEGTPAFRAGLRPEDIIARVDGEGLVAWSLNDAVDRITGKQGTPVTLGIKRGDEPEIEVTIIRERIDLPSVLGWTKTGLNDAGKAQWNWMIDPENRIGYVRLTGFSEDTFTDLQAAWNDMKAQGATGLILDLRFNPGGLLDQAWQIANLFIDEGDIVTVEGKPDTRIERLPAQRNRAQIKDAGVGVVVLINKGSASASEIVAGALQAHDAAVVVGTRSWGKGSVQRVFGIPRAPDAQLKLTTQYYRLPANRRKGEVIGRIVHKRPGADLWGVDPDIEVDMTPDQITKAIDLRDKADLISNVEGEDDRPDINELITSGLDPQLETALLILQARTIRQYGVEHARLND